MPKKMFSTRRLVLLALLTAISIILSRFCVIYITESVRISFGNIPILLAGLMFGPVAGALVGAAADILGSAFLSGLGWFPPLTVAPMLMGLLPALLRPILLKKVTMPRLGSVILICNVIASMGWTTYWLHIKYGTPFLALLSIRVPLYIGIAVLETLVVSGLCKTKLLNGFGLGLQQKSKNGGDTKNEL